MPWFLSIPDPWRRIDRAYLSIIYRIAQLGATHKKRPPVKASIGVNEAVGFRPNGAPGKRGGLTAVLPTVRVWLTPAESSL